MYPHRVQTGARWEITVSLDIILFITAVSDWDSFCPKYEKLLCCASRLCQWSSTSSSSYLSMPTSSLSTRWWTANFCCITIFFSFTSSLAWFCWKRCKITASPPSTSSLSDIGAGTPFSWMTLLTPRISMGVSCTEIGVQRDDQEPLLINQQWAPLWSEGIRDLHLHPREWANCPQCDLQSLGSIHYSLFDRIPIIIIMFTLIAVLISSSHGRHSLLLHIDA